METYYKAINWNAIEDVIDKSTWEKLTEQFWLDTRIPLSNDLDDWRKLSNKEKETLENETNTIASDALRKGSSVAGKYLSQKRIQKNERL